MSADLPRILTHWLADSLSSSPPPADVVAFNVGLFEVEDGFCAYLAGSIRFDEHDDDWAVDPSYKPEAAYLALPNAVYGLNDWQTCLQSVMSAVRCAMASPVLSCSPMSRVNVVTVGFDDGDLHRVK